MTNSLLSKIMRSEGDNECAEMETLPLSGKKPQGDGRRAPFRHHVATQRFFKDYPIFRRIPLLAQLCEQFGIFFVSTIGVTYFLNKGLTSHILASATLPLFKGELGVDVAMYQRLIAVGFMAWSMKPLIAVVSDLTTIFGFHKRYILLAASIGSSIFLFIASSLPRGQSLAVAEWGGIVFFVANLCCAALDILPEGRYSEMIALRPRAASALVSWVWSCVMIGGCVAALLQGPLADAGLVRASLMIAGTSQLLLVVPIQKNWFGERLDRDASSMCISFHAERAVQHRRLTYLSLGMSLGIGLSAIAALFLGNLSLLIITVVFSAVLCGGSFAVLPRTAALANTFMFLKELLYIQLPGPLDYFYTADQQCVADGPQFSYAYYQTFTVIVGYIAGAAGVALFHKFFACKKFQYTFWCTAALKIAASVVDVIIVKRWNRALGLDDRVSYLLGDAIVFGMCQMLDFMPAVVLTSRLCPRGMEATTYAILAGFSNLGQALSNATGSLLVEFVWPISTTPPCDFSNLPQLLVVGHGLLPLFVIPLSLLMVPNMLISDEFAPEEGVSS